jgi:hypothetical protein
VIRPSPNLEEASDYDARCLRSNLEEREPPTPTNSARALRFGGPERRNGEVR